MTTTPCSYPSENKVPPLKGDFRTLPEAMDAAVRQFGNREAYVEGEQRLSFNDWVRAADGLAAVMRELGVRRGNVVAIALPSSIDYAICYAAVVRIGAIATGINLRLGQREIASILDQCAPKLLVAETDLSIPSTTANPEVLRRSELSAFYGEAPIGNVETMVPDDPVIIVWTSGTTGTPKGAWFDHDNLKAAVTMAGSMAAPFDRRIMPLPFAHGGYMTKVWEQVAFGITNVLTPTPWNALEMLRLLESERITVAAGVPTQWEKLVESPELVTTDLSHLRLCVTATAPASPELVQKVVTRFGCPLISRYAMTEAPSITGTTPRDSSDVLCRTVGQPQSGVELMITDRAGNPVKPGETGHIRTRSACVMRGYWGAPDLTRSVLTLDGWLISSDLGYTDSDGNLVLVGRDSDMYIRGGYNVYPLEVENTLMEHPDVAQASVIGVKTPVIGEIGVAFIVPVSTATPPSLEELRAWCRERLADYKVPDEMVIVSQLPLTAMMKVDKQALRKHYKLSGSA